MKSRPILFCLLSTLLTSLGYPALSADTGATAQQRYLCAGTAGLTSEILSQRDPQSSRQLKLKAQALVEAGVALEVSQNVKQVDAIAALAIFLKGREAIYRSNPAQAIRDIDSCHALNMLPPMPRITESQIASVVSLANAPTSRTNRPTPAPSSQGARPNTTTSGEAGFRRFLIGPWGRMKSGSFDRAMIMSTTFKIDGPKFTRASCPTSGLGSPGEMLSHEIWFEERSGGEFGMVIAGGDPGKTTLVWNRLTFKDYRSSGVWRYEFYNANLMKTALLTLKQVGPDRITKEVEIPGISLPRTQEMFGRCRQR